MDNLKGFLASAISAVSFGLIPLFTLPLQADGLASSSILYYRFLLAAAMVLLFMLALRKKLEVNKKELMLLLALSLLYNGSSYFLFLSFKYLASGVAYSIQMVYPVFVVLISVWFFKTQGSIPVIISVICGVCGVMLFSWGEAQQGANLFGVLLSLTGALCYAVYLLIVQQTSLKKMESFKLTFYVLLFSGLFFFALAAATGTTQPLRGHSAIYNIFMLAVVSTVIANIALVVGIKKVGAIIASILGALSPVTSVVVGVWIFKEQFTDPVALGLIFVMTSIFITVFSQPLDPQLKGILNRLFGHLGLHLK